MTIFKMKSRRPSSCVFVIVGIAWVAGLAACARPPYQIKTPFVEQDFQAWNGEGPAALSGQAFLKTVGGEVKTCAGATVVLFPANSYGREMIEAERSGRSRVANVDPRAAKYIRSAICDAQGNFAFSGLPTGAWFVETEVSWGIPTGSMLFPVDEQGGVLVQEERLVPGSNRAILTAADLAP